MSDFLACMAIIGCVLIGLAVFFVSIKVCDELHFGEAAGAIIPASITLCVYGTLVFLLFRKAE